MGLKRGGRARLAEPAGRAATELQRAAGLARQAEDAAAAKDFQFTFNNAVLAYNTALDLLRDCR